MFNILGQFQSDYIEGIGAHASEVNQHLLNPHSKIFRNAINLTVAGSYLDDINIEEDYHGTWEDSFLFQGYENGKHGFLTSLIANIIGRHGFVAYTTNHKPQYRCPNLGKNDIIIALGWHGKNVIPEKDKNNNPVIVGVTEPRLYLPDVVTNLMDLEFGYDKENLDTETVTKQMMT